MNEKLIAMTRNPLIVGGTALAGGVAIGFAVGYSVAKRIVTKNILDAENQLSDEVSRVTTILEQNQLKIDFVSEELIKRSVGESAILDETTSDPVVETINILDPRFNPENILLDEIEPEDEGFEILGPTSKPEFVETNVFSDEIEGWDWEAELASRNSDEPYVIHRDEFYGEETPWDNQQQFTWHSGDGIMTNDRDQVIYDWHKFVGDLNFGHGSGNPDVFYVRNPKMRAEYEVTLVPGSYSVDVIAEQYEEELSDTELKHSWRPGKFRLE